jgi:methylenetetrahydrofolate reductase (NADPH)
MMQAGEIAGCVVSDTLVHRLDRETKSERLERGALMVAACRDLGFAGAHIGGFGLTHRDMLEILDRAAGIGAGWRGRIDELSFGSPGGQYLFPAGTDGLSNGSGPYQVRSEHPRPRWTIRLGRAVHRRLVRPGSAGASFLAARLSGARRGGSRDRRRGFWHAALGLSTGYRKLALGCVDCGDCLQDHLGFVGCTMRWCYKTLRNGPCGGSRPDGSCEVEPGRPCIWNNVYLGLLAAGDDPRRLAHILVPPRDWSLDRTNSLANRLLGIDNYDRRARVEPAPSGGAAREEGKAC